MELIAVVMGCETSAMRFAACKSMLDYGFANFALVTPAPEDTYTVPVVLGKGDTVTAVPGEDATLLIDKSQRSSISTHVVLDESVKAPVSQGQRLGTMEIRSGEQVLRQIPMVAESTVERLTFWDIFGKILRRVVMVKDS